MRLYLTGETQNRMKGIDFTLFQPAILPYLLLHELPEGDAATIYYNTSGRAFDFFFFPTCSHTFCGEPFENCVVTLLFFENELLEP